jgi:hypothetical protein
MRILLITALLLLVAAPVAAEPCGGLAIARGAVNTAQPLPFVAVVEGGAATCAKGIADALNGMPALRTVTVAARLPDAERLGGQALAHANLWAEALAQAGVPRSKLSTVAPAAGTGEGPSIKIEYTEKKASHPVALAESVGGQVLAGGSITNLSSIEGGSMLAAKSAVETGVGGRVTFGLADGSRLRLAERSVLVFGSLHLNDEMKRVVQLDLLRGSIEAHVSPGGAGSSFEVNTKTGVAGAKGTSFRVVAGDEGTRVETLTGLVALTGPDQKQVDIGAGMRSDLSEDGVPSEPAEMLGEPTLRFPLQGEYQRGKKLKWAAVKGAGYYVVDIARDADFTLEGRTIEAKRGSEPVPADLTAGKWFWRVTPHEASGAAGLSSRIYAFTLAE